MAHVYEQADGRKLDDAAHIEAGSLVALSAEMMNKCIERGMRSQSLMPE